MGRRLVIVVSMTLAFAVLVALCMGWQCHVHRTPAAHARVLYLQTQLRGQGVRDGLEAYKRRHGSYPPTDRPFPSPEESVFYHLSQDEYVPGFGAERIKQLQTRGEFRASGHSQPVFLDGYANPFSYQVLGSRRAPDRIVVKSCGPNGLAGDADDVLF